MADDKRFGPEASAEVVHSAGITSGAELEAGYAARRGIHCNVEGTYRIYCTDGETYTDRFLVAGALYPYANTKITTTADGNVTDGDVSAEA